VIVVVAVIGILATIVYGSMGKARTIAIDKERVNYIKEFMLVLRVYKDQNGQYPPQTPYGNIYELAGDLIPTYISALPDDDIYAYWPLPMVGDCAINPSCNVGAQLPKEHAMVATIVDGDYEWCNRENPPKGQKECGCYFASPGFEEAIPNGQDIGVDGSTPGYPWENDGMPWWLENEAGGGFVPCTSL
jgi:type II secretory pathway pseudopilin PulG